MVQSQEKWKNIVNRSHLIQRTKQVMLTCAMLHIAPMCGGSFPGTFLIEGHATRAFTIPRQWRPVVELPGLKK